MKNNNRGYTFRLMLAATIFLASVTVILAAVSGGLTFLQQVSLLFFAISLCAAAIVLGTKPNRNE